MMASTEPWTSPLMIRGSSETFLSCSLAIMSAKVAPGAAVFTVVAFSRF